MNLFQHLKRFHNDEDGAVTVDWVVLTAAIVGLGIAIGSMLWEKTSAISQNIGTQLENSSTIKNSF